LIKTKHPIIALGTLCALVLQISSAHAAPGARDVTPPRVLHEIVRTASLGNNIDILVRFEDQSQIFEPKLYFRRVGEDLFNAIDLIVRGNGTWVGTIPGSVVTRDLEYFLEAFDVFGNGPSWHGTQEHPHFIKVLQQGAAEPPKQIHTERSGMGQAAEPMATQALPTPVVEVHSESVVTKWWFWTIVVVAVGGISVGVLCATHTGICPSTPVTFSKVTIDVTGPDLRDGL
jgi:hypothetical protein